MGNAFTYNSTSLEQRDGSDDSAENFVKNFVKNFVGSEPSFSREQ